MACPMTLPSCDLRWGHHLILLHGADLTGRTCNQLPSEQQHHLLRLPLHDLGIEMWPPASPIAWFRYDGAASHSTAKPMIGGIREFVVRKEVESARSLRYSLVASTLTIWTTMLPKHTPILVSSPSSYTAITSSRPSSDIY
ncbi:hypothetical protein D1007_17000 [Hordeum vulgare]|nr:hypothetical protein D1007_17000 [Hordeum vulgare]